MKTISRDDILDIHYMEMFKKESHHDHKIILDNGIFRWKENDHIVSILKTFPLNDIIVLFNELGIHKNHEVYRKLYRDIGYSLFGYWEVFYWEVNNPHAKDYNYFIQQPS